MTVYIVRAGDDEAPVKIGYSRPIRVLSIFDGAQSSGWQMPDPFGCVSTLVLTALFRVWFWFDRR